MKRIFILSMLLCMALSSYAQDWTSDASKLYYYTREGKVYMEADYSSMAIYFKESPSEQVARNLEVAAPAVKAEIMGNKGLIGLKSVEGLASIKNASERKAFLSAYNLDAEQAYDVLPSFKVNGEPALMTQRVSFRLAEGVKVGAIASTLEKYGATLVRSMLRDEIQLVNVPVIENQLPMIQELAETGLVQWAEPDFIMDIKKYDDPLYPYQWHLNNTGGTDYDGTFALTADVDIDAPEAWEITTGSSDITIAVIDDGMNAHEDFPTLLPGYTPANNGDGTPDNSAYHGVPCGGLVFAQHNDIGVRGVAPGVNAFSVNIFASGTSNADLADAVIWAVDQGADVLTNSWGYGSCNTNVAALTDAFEYAAEEGRDGLGCVILIASGNDYMTCVSYPANLDNVTAVGAVKGSGVRAEYSNYGNDLDITAPSCEFVLNNQGTAVIDIESDIVTTDIAGNGGSYSGDYYYEFGGTSAATPIAAGVACLVLSVDPSLTKSEVENILYSTAVDYGANGYDNEYGNGLVNAYAAVLAAGGDDDDDDDDGDDGGDGDCDLSDPGAITVRAQDDDGFRLVWDFVDGADSYAVTIGDDISGTTTSRFFLASGLDAGTTYTCTVASVCADGSIGGVSTVSATTTGTALALSPNPASNTLNVSTTIASATYVIRDFSGMVVQSGELQGGAIDLGALRSGVYMIEVSGEGELESLRFIKE